LVYIICKDSAGNIWLLLGNSVVKTSFAALKMPPERSRNQLEADLAITKAELNFVRRSQAIASFTSIFLAFIRYGAFCVLGYFATKCVSAMAGRTTYANMAMTFLVKMKADKWIAYTLGGGGMLYGWSERRLRQRNIKRFGQAAADMEKVIDPQRSSSHLSTDGTTHPLDRQVI